MTTNVPSMPEFILLKKLTREEAKQNMWNYYNENRTTMPPDIRERREIIIELLMKGVSQKDAFDGLYDHIRDKK